MVTFDPIISDKSSDFRFKQIEFDLFCRPFRLFECYYRQLLFSLSTKIFIFFCYKNGSVYSTWRGSLPFIPGSLFLLFKPISILSKPLPYWRRSPDAHTGARMLPPPLASVASIVRGATSIHLPALPDGAFLLPDQSQ